MQYRVYVTPHALRQWHCRVNESDSIEHITSMVRLRLKNQIRLGIKANARGAFELKLVPGLIAIMRVDGRGWAVITFVLTTSREQLLLPG